MPDPKKFHCHTWVMRRGHSGGMRILHVVPSYYPAIRYGGPVRSVHGLAAAQVQNGHIVDVFTTNIDGDRDLDVPLDRPVDMDGVRVHYFLVSRLRRLCVAPSMVPAIRRQLDNTEMVHLHSVYLWPTYVAARAAYKAGVPYLVAPRGMLVKNLIEEKSSFAKKCWINFVEKTSLKRAAGIHVTTEAERDDLHQLGLAISETYCVPNGVAVPNEIKPYPRYEAEIGDVPYVLFVGRLNWKKGLDKLISAWLRIPENFRLVIAGNDEDGYRSVLESQVKDFRLGKHVIFLGEVPDDQKWDLYRRASLLVLPSISENFGNVVLEAMAMGCPVLVSTGVGLADLVSRTNCGMVSSNEPEELGAKMNSLLRNPELRHMGERGREAVRDRYSWGAVARDMDQVYQQVRSGSPSSRLYA